MSARRKRKSCRHNAKGRSIGHHFMKLDDWFWDCEAWASLKPQVAMVYLTLLWRFNGHNNGKIGLSCRDAAKECHIGKEKASAAFKELEAKGFIKCHYKGSFSQKQRNRASEWELTAQPMGEKPATKDFMRWQAGPKIKHGPCSRPE